MGMSQAAHSTPQKTSAAASRAKAHDRYAPGAGTSIVFFFGITVDMITINYGYNHDIYIYTYMYVCNVMYVM